MDPLYPDSVNESRARLLPMPEGRGFRRDDLGEDVGEIGGKRRAGTAALTSLSRPRGMDLRQERRIAPPKADLRSPAAPQRI